jgi:hypothetical protein
LSNPSAINSQIATEVVLGKPALAPKKALKFLQLNHSLKGIFHGELLVCLGS